MEQDFNSPYKSNYTLGIIFTILSLLTVVGNIVTILMPSIGCIVSIASLISAILLLVWFFRSHKNLLAFNTMGLKYSPGWAVGAFFVPILNLFRPYQIAQEIWKASDPEASTVGWKQSKISIVVILWWLSVFLSIIITSATMGYGISMGIQAGLSGVEPDIASISNAVSIPSMVGMGLYTILTISMVVLTNDRQDEKAENLGIL
ncbi:MAG: DUF4328 domain-containing protein [Anaerolineaceae bacterium]|nr:DUF4328 domain-containing protein [Anaerolineaceae bacterium]